MVFKTFVDASEDITFAITEKHIDASNEGLEGSLPQEILSSILSHLDFLSLVRCSMVCRIWYESSLDQRIWKRHLKLLWKHHAKDDGVDYKQKLKDHLEEMTMNRIQHLHIRENIMTEGGIFSHPIEIVDQLFHLIETSSINPNHNLSLLYYARDTLDVINRKECARWWDELYSSDVDGILREYFGEENPHSLKETALIEVGSYLVSRYEEPFLDPQIIKGELDELAERVKSRTNDTEDDEDKLKALLHVLFVEEDFDGDNETYYHPHNGYIHHVLKKKRGIPIILSIILILVASRVGLRIDPIGFPGRFLARVLSESGTLMDEPTYIDAFEQGQMMTEEECYNITEFIQPGMFDVISPSMIFIRMSHNLVHMYKSSGSYIQLLGILSLMDRLGDLSGTPMPQNIVLRYKWLLDGGFYLEAKAWIEKFQGSMRDVQMDVMIKQTEVMLEAEEIRMSRIRDRNVAPYNKMNLQFKVGDVIYCIGEMSRGVIDEDGHYRLLMENEHSEMTVVLEDSIHREENAVDHPRIGEYFQEFEPQSHRYVCNPGMRRTYPNL
ncbi:hypothetical protein PROFUN_03365 [Planoprotostelium fungivorum]|uniref:F-box domain-containing protein n=1 Tax=Planoprotostelium fungivorum TaxID=1890364 RepID=A0A2P6NWF1_9EUKA|nr:hypothetical protein PROFUN_03365 [Planoprotostelium fungivorum]